MTPEDDMVYIGNPTLFRPEADEVHISVTFTWDMKEGYRLQQEWAQYYPVVKIGGPAISGSNGEFEPGMYLKRGVTITSRGCTRKCPWCFVPNYEGKIKLLEIKDGHILQDNNILATPRSHQEKVYKMLGRQKEPAKFAGGVDTRLVDDWVAEHFKNMRTSYVFLAADTKGSLKSLKKAVDKLSFLGINKTRCFVMIGYREETVEEAEYRLKSVWDIGCTPHSQLYQPPDKKIRYPQEWMELNRNWSRPAIIRSMMLKN